MEQAQVDFNKQPPGAEAVTESLELQEMMAEAKKVTPSRGIIRDDYRGVNPRSYESQVNEFDSGIHVEFYVNPEDGLEHVRMEFPGDEYQKPDFLVDERYIARFPEQYAAFKREESQATGNMIAQFDWATRIDVAELARKNINTLEQLARCADAFIERVPNGMKLRDKAREELGVKKETGIIAPVAKQLDALMAENAKLHARLSALEKPAKATKKLQPVDA